MLRYIGHTLLALCLVPPTVFAQDNSEARDDRGHPFYLEHFPAHEYRAHPQNWSIVQDEQGIIYVGNYDGVLAYGGREWEVIETPSNTTVRSLAVGLGDRVWAGQQGDFGYLAPDTLGRTRFVSLLDKIPSEDRAFWDVWSTHATEEHVFFQTKTRLYRWDGSAFNVWKTSSGYHTSFEVDETIYVREKGVGLLRVRGDSLELIPDGRSFAHRQVFAMGRLLDGRLLIATQKGGLFAHDGMRAARLRTEADDYLDEHRLYHGAVLKSGHIALAMLDGGGIVVLSPHGRVVQHLTEGDGLPDGWVNHVYVDAQDGLWLALNNQGVARVDPLSAITAYGSRSGLEGFVHELKHHDGYLYAANSTGLFVLPPRRDLFDKSRFERVEGIAVATALVEIGNDLLVTGHGGVFSVKEDRISKLVDGTYFGVGTSEYHPNRVYLSSKTGISLFERNNEVWTIHRDFVALGEEIYSVIEDANGDLWASTRSGKVYRIRIDRSPHDVKEFRFPTESAVGQITFARLDGQVIVLGRTGYYAADSGSRDYSLRFFPYEKSGPAANAADTLLAAYSTYGKLWKVFSDRVEIVEDCDNKCVKRTPEILKYPKWNHPSRVYVDPSGIAWISTGNLVVRYDPSNDAEKSYEVKFPALLRRVTSIDSNRLLYGGARRDKQSRAASLIPDLPFVNNALRFEFSLPSYNDVSGNEFQYWLEGKDEGWSAWTKEASKNYTNLREGTYRFHLRGRNAQGYVSSESVYTFAVLPPWYRSLWAYGAYFLVLVGVGLFVRRHHHMVIENKKAKEQAKELRREREVNERLQDLNKRLQQANETLRQADRLKDEFLANTSHELRTPLTGILGCSSILREEVSDEQREFVDMIDENGHRLLNTLDSLLDLARLRAGLMELDFRMIDVAEKARTIVQSYEPLANSKGVKVDVRADGNVRGLYDDHCLECVLNHLIGNAVKFTDEGRVLVNVVQRGDRLTIEVEDTGVGIDEEFMPYLFDEFKQESTGLTRSHEGNGLGLAVAARIVELLGGDIEVHSVKGAGSTFTVRLPLEQTFEEGADASATGTASSQNLAAA